MSFGIAASTRFESVRHSNSQQSRIDSGLSCSDNNGLSSKKVRQNHRNSSSYVACFCMLYVIVGCFSLLCTELSAS